MTEPCPEERLELGVEVQLDAHVGPVLLDRLDDVGVGGVAERPRVGVDDVRLYAAVRERGDHLDAERRRLHHDGTLHVVEALVPLLGGPDVLDVVQPVEVTARNARVRILEARRDDESVPRNGALPANLMVFALRLIPVTVVL